MEVLRDILHWGSPLGVALFLFISASGAAIFFWGLSHFIESARKSKEEKT